MSIQTNIHFLNANDPEYLAAKNGSPAEREDWEDRNGFMGDRPGAPIEVDSSEYVTETNDEYGGWIVDVRQLPPETTHIVISRS